MGLKAPHRKSDQYKWPITLRTKVRPCFAGAQRGCIKKFLVLFFRGLLTIQNRRDHKGIVKTFYLIT